MPYNHRAIRLTFEGTMRGESELSTASGGPNLGSVSYEIDQFHEHRDKTKRSASGHIFGDAAVLGKVGREGVRLRLASGEYLRLSVALHELDQTVAEVKVYGRAFTR